MRGYNMNKRELFISIIILLISGTMSLNALLATLLPFYLFISIIEGAANVVIISAIKTMKPEIMEINEWYYE